MKRSTLLCALHEHLERWPGTLLHVGTSTLAFLVVALPGVGGATAHEARVGAEAVEERMPITRVALATDLRQLCIFLLHQLRAAGKVGLVGIDDVLIAEGAFQHRTHLTDPQRIALQSGGCLEDAGQAALEEEEIGYELLQGLNCFTLTLGCVPELPHSLL